MDVVSLAFCQPGPDLGMCVGGVVVDGRMHIERLWDVGIDVAQEREELLVPMARLALGKHFATGDIQCGEQGGGGVSYGVVGHTFHVTQAHGQHGLGKV